MDVRLDRRARWARLALTVYMAVLLLSTAESLAALLGHPYVLGGTRDAMSTPEGVLFTLILATMVAAIVLVAMWIYRAHANVREAGIGQLPISPAWAVIWFFVPIANLFKPFDAMRQLWRASQADAVAEAGAWLLQTWWAAWVLGTILGNVSYQLAENGYTIPTVAAVDCIGNAAMMLAAWLLARIIRRVTEAQRLHLDAAATFA